MTKILKSAFPRLLVTVFATFLLILLVLGAVRYSTLIENLVADPMISEWKGPAAFRIGTSPNCGDLPCWVATDLPLSDWEMVDIPKTYLKERFRDLSSESVFYRFDVSIPENLQKSEEAVSFSPNWVVHRNFDIYVNGKWTSSGHGVTKTGDIIYQKVVIPLPREAVNAGKAVVVIAASIGPEDLGIQHLGRILVGPSTDLGRLHVEAEFAMGSYYLLFLSAQGAIFIFFSLFYLLARTRRGFGAFLAYAFLMTTIHLSIGNFLEGIVPLSSRIWLYFLAKGGATALLCIVLGTILWPRGIPRLWFVASSLPFLAAFTLLVDFAFGTHSANIAIMHSVANAMLLGAIAVVIALAMKNADIRTKRLGSWVFTGGYLIFLAWTFSRPAQDFDYRPLADLAFFYFIAWLTISEFGLTQARAQILDANYKRLFSVFARLTGSRLATHLVIKGSPEERQKHESTVMIVDFRNTTRLMRKYGSESTLSMLDNFLETVTKCVEDHGGEINKILGDKVLAVWGLDKSDSTGCERAVQAGLQIRETINQANKLATQTGDQQIAWATAVCTGQIISGRIGKGHRTDYGVFGTAVSRAFALVQSAKEMSIDLAMDHTTTERLRDNIIVQPFEFLSQDMGESEAFVLIAHGKPGAWHFGDLRWQMRFGDRMQAGRVYDAGANLDIYVRDEDEDQKAA